MDTSGSATLLLLELELDRASSAELNRLGLHSVCAIGNPS